MAELLAASDVVTLHCPLTPETTGLIDAAALGSMKRSAVLVNVARGGAAIYVFETEPLPPRSPLLALDTLVVTPHLARIAADNFKATVGPMFGNIACAMRGEPIREADLVP